MQSREREFSAGVRSFNRSPSDSAASVTFRRRATPGWKIQCLGNVLSSARPRRQRRRIRFIFARSRDDALALLDERKQQMLRTISGVHPFPTVGSKIASCAFSVYLLMS